MSDTPPSRHTLRNALLGLLGVVLLSLAMWAPLSSGPAGGGKAAETTGSPPPPPENSLPVVPVGGDFRLPSTAGTELALADLRGKVVLLNFGFTQCPDVCPMVLTRLGHALRELEKEGIDSRRVQPLFITFDPERDTLPHLREYVAYFHPSLLGLRGDDAQTRELARQYKVIYLKQDSGSAGGYVFQHSDFIYVIDTWGRVRLLVGGKDPDMALVAAVKRLLSEGERER